MRVSNQIIHNVKRALPRRFSAGGAFGGTTHAIGTTSPGTRGLEIAMGLSGNDGIVTICPDTAADITAYIWNPIRKLWVLLGANSTQYTKTFEANGIDGFNLPEGTPFFLKASAVVVDCDTDATQFSSNPD